MKQVISLPRTIPCSNCTGNTQLEFDRIDVGLEDGKVMHLSAVPYYQCTECDHRQMEPLSKERLGEGIEAFLAETPGTGADVIVSLHWREVIALDLAGEPQASERLYEVEWEWMLL